MKQPKPGEPHDRRAHMDPEERMVSHGLTLAEVLEIQYNQNAGTDDETIPANVIKEFKIKPYNKNIVHIALERTLFSPSGQKLSKPFVAKINPNQFNMMVKMNHFAGYATKILHDPSKGRTSTKALNKWEKEIIAAQERDGVDKAGGLVVSQKSLPKPEVPKS